jgi:uncharacterized membrane protein
LSEIPSVQEKTKDLIVDIIEKQKPESLQRLIKAVQKIKQLSDDDIIKLLIELSNEKRITLSELRTKKVFGDYIFSLDAVWYWCVLIISVLTSLVVLVIPENLFYMWLVRNVLGLFLVLYLPGYVLFKNLFHQGINFRKNLNLDIIEQITLSISFSLAISAITGLSLYTLKSLNLLNVTLGLMVVTILLATTALVSDYLTLEKYFQKIRKNAEYFIA